MQAVALLESKIPRGQQKLHLKSVVELQRDLIATAKRRRSHRQRRARTWLSVHRRAATNERRPSWRRRQAGPLLMRRAVGSIVNIRSPIFLRAWRSIICGRSFAVDHMRSMQATCGARHHATTDTNDGVPANVNVTTPPFYTDATGASSLFGVQQQHQPQPPAVGNTTSWQDPRIHLAAAAVDNSTCHHDIADFVAKDSLCEDVVAGTHDCTHIVVKSASKPKLDNITLSQWSIANLTILYVLLGEGKLLAHKILDYLSYSTKVYELTQRYENTSVYLILYDRCEYRKLQACHGFRWGTDIPPLQTIRRVPRVTHSDRRPRPQHPPYVQTKQVVAGPMTGEGRAICRLYHTQRGCGYNDCKFVQYSCSYRGCFQVYPATVRLSLK